MTDQKLVDELEKALRDEAYDGGFGYMGDEQFTAYVRTLAEAAAEVFEKAHTPTDDEREALRIAELDARQAAFRQDRTEWFVDHEHEPEVATNAFFRGWDAAVDGGFRRTEVPEPSAQRIGCNICGEALPDGEPHLCSEPQGEQSGRVIVMCARCGLFPVVAGDEINSDIVVCDRCAFAEGRESVQGEPSDAQAALDLKGLAEIIGDVVVDHADTGPHSQRAITIRDTCAAWPDLIAGEVQAHGFRRSLPLSDEALDAAFEAFRKHDRGEEFNEFGEHVCSECGYAYSWPSGVDGRQTVPARRRQRHIARAALRAAGVVAQEGESRG